MSVYMTAYAQRAAKLARPCAPVSTATATRAPRAPPEPTKARPVPAHARLVLPEQVRRFRAR